MDELDQVLAAMKREYEPDEEAPKRVRALIGGSLSVLGTSQVGAAASGSASSGSAGSGSAASGSVAPGGAGVGTHAGWLGTTGLKAVLAVLAIGGATAVGVYSQTSGQAQPQRARPPAVVAHEMAPSPPVPTVPADVQPQDTERPQQAPVHREALTAPPAPRAERETNALVRRGHTLEELQLLSGASQALRAGQLDQAERALEAHRARYPASALARERHGLSLELACTRGATAAMRAEAERFVRTDATSPISNSVQKKCLP